MMASAPASYATTWSNTLGNRGLASWSRSLRIAELISSGRTAWKNSRGGPWVGRPSRTLRYAGTVRSALGAAGERMPSGLVLGEDFVDRRRALERPGDRLLHRLVVERI